MIEYLKECNIKDVHEDEVLKPVLGFRKRRKYAKFFKENYGAMKKDTEVRRKYHLENQKQIEELSLNG